MKTLSGRIATGLILGVIAGVLLGERASVLGELGKILITLIKTIAAPLIFLAIIDAILNSEMTWRQGRSLFQVVIINGFFAASIGMGLSNLFQPGRLLDATMLPTPSAQEMKKFEVAQQKIDVIKAINSYIPTNIVQPFFENSIISLVILALFIGFALKQVRTMQLEHGHQGYKTVEDFFATILRIFEVGLGWVIQFIPVAIFGVVAKTVGEYGFAPVKGLMAYLAVGILGLTLQIFVIYQVWIKFICGRKLTDFWKEAKEPVLYALGCNSSLATLPVTLKTLDRLKVSKSSARMGACVGTNLNNDGILLYEAMAVLFVAQAYGLHLTFSQQALTMGLAVIGAIGVAGIPEAGLISLSLVLATVGLPLEILPLLLTVDWIIARGRSVTNVLGDIVTAMAIDAIEHRATSSSGHQVQTLKQHALRAKP